MRAIALNMMAAKWSSSCNPCWNFIRCRFSEATQRLKGIPRSQLRSAYLAAPMRSQWPWRSSAKGEIRSGRGLSSAVSRMALPWPKDCRLPLSTIPYLLMVFFSRYNFEVIATVLVGEVFRVVGELLCFDLGDMPRLQNGSGHVASSLMDLNQHVPTSEGALNTRFRT